MDFAANLKRLRQERKLSQEQLALKCGWSGQSRIANYESTSRLMAMMAQGMSAMGGMQSWF